MWQLPGHLLEQKVIILVYLDVFWPIQVAVEIMEHICDLKMTLKALKAYIGYHSMKIE